MSKYIALDVLSWRHRLGLRYLTVIVFLAGFGLVAAAVGPLNVSYEAEAGTRTGTAATLTDATASGGSAVKFNAASGGGVPNPLKIMPLGDSMTQGAVDGGSPSSYNPLTINGYRLDLWNLLTEYHIDYVGPYQLGNASLSDHDLAGESGACIKTSPCGGSTMYPLKAGWLNTYNPDLVIMQGGGNDYSNHSIGTPQIEGYMESWIQLIFATKPNIKIIVCGNAQWNDDLEALTKAYVEGLQAQGKAIRFCPIAATAGAQANTIDGTHPGVTGYQIWANELAPLVRQLFP